jgi:hypothetical protein
MTYGASVGNAVSGEDCWYPVSRWKFGNVPM